VKDLLSNVGSGGGAAAAGPAAGAAAGGDAPAAAEEKKEEEGMTRISALHSNHAANPYENLDMLTKNSQLRKSRTRIWVSVSSTKVPESPPFPLRTTTTNDTAPTIFPLFSQLHGSWGLLYTIRCGVKEAISGCLGEMKNLDYSSHSLI
jgi:hypothetical protein